MIYRKAKNARTWYSIDGEIVCRVIHEFSGYTIYRGSNRLIKWDAEDMAISVDISKEDFLSAYKIAKTGTDIDVTFI
jgi:hypothetical protein